MSSAFPYRGRGTPIFGTVLRPLVDFEARSEVTGEWVRVEDALADTGADASVLPLHIGMLVVNKVASGKKHVVHGVVPGASLSVFVHRVDCRIGRRRFTAPTLIADSIDVPAILGRAGAIDRWRATYAHGRLLRIRK